jgi:hypothetical protein
METNEILTPEQSKALGGICTWSLEAVRKSDGARLFTTVAYRHTTRGDWKAGLVHADGRVEKLARIPRILLGSKTWTLTPYGVDVREEGRQ